jgi:hypothetical protein
VIKTPKFISLSLALWLAVLPAATPAKAQSSQNGSFGLGPIHRGLVVGAIVGIGAVVGVAITFLVLHNRGVVSGCIVESGGKRTLAGSGNKVYSLLDTGLSPPVGDRVKVKGHTSGPSSAPSLQVEKILKDYGHCPS